MQTQTATTTLELLLTCQNPPPLQHEGQPAEFGLQDKQQQLHAGTAQTNGAVHFVCRVDVRNVNSGLDFAGQWVQGPRGGRFLYFGYRLHGTPGWIRRWKVSLQGIRAGQLAAVVAQPGKQLCTSVLLDNRTTIRPEGNDWVVA